MGRGDLTDRQWEQLAPHLPPEHTGQPGHPWSDHRRVINGIRWVLRTGASWRDLPERYGPWQTCSDRFGRWRRDGTGDRLLQTVQGEQEAVGESDWEVSIDSSVVRAHQHAAGAPHQPAVGEKGGAIRRTKRSAAVGVG